GSRRDTHSKGVSVRSDVGMSSGFEKGLIKAVALPQLGSMDDLLSFDHGEEEGKAVLFDLLQFGRIGPVHPLDIREVLGELLVDLPLDSGSHEHEDTSREDDDECGEHPRVPEGEARTDAPGLHSRSSPSTKPTPRTVRRSLGSNGSSILRRR